jgi:hypothetical protein
MRSYKSPFFGLFAALIGQVFVTAAFAQQPQPTMGPYRTEEMQMACKLALTKNKPLSDPEQQSMIMYVQATCLSAVSTTMRMGPQMNDKFRFCPPPSTTPEQVIPILLEFIEKNPQVLPYDIRDIANYVGRLQWPCQ